MKIFVCYLSVTSACGYRPARPSFTHVAIPVVTSDVPQPEVAACLTEELRMGLAERGVTVERRADLNLLGEVVRVEGSPGSIGMTGRPVALDQVSTLVFRYRLVHRDRGTLWGPVNLRVERRSALGPGAMHSAAAAEEALRAGCRKAATRIIDELVTAEPPQ